MLPISWWFQLNINLAATLRMNWVWSSWYLVRPTRVNEFVRWWMSWLTVLPSMLVENVGCIFMILGHVAGRYISWWVCWLGRTWTVTYQIKLQSFCWQKIFQQFNLSGERQTCQTSGPVSVWCNTDSDFVRLSISWLLAIHLPKHPCHQKFCLLEPGTLLEDTMSRLDSHLHIIGGWAKTNGWDHQCLPCIVPHKTNGYRCILYCSLIFGR